MHIDDFDNIRPEFVENNHEPSLHNIIIDWYVSHDVPLEQAREYATRYIAQFVSQSNLFDWAARR